MSDLSNLHDRLDTLWTAYLQHLDAYTESQKVIQKHMSAGFLSLARANFNAHSGVRRYGKDFYHDRAVATKRVDVDSESNARKPRVSIVKWSESQSEDDTNGAPGTKAEPDETKDSGDHGEVKQQPSPPVTPEPEDESDKLHEKDREEMDETATSKKQSRPKLEADPIRWFGVLVPPALRSAQTSFAASVDDAVAGSVNAAKGMRESEIEIRKLRKEIRKAEREAKVV